MTSMAQIEATAAGKFRVTGALTFATVRQALRAPEFPFDSSGPLQVDLSGVTHGDSAGLALLIEWYRRAARANCDIRFVGVPAQLRALAKISDVDKLLALDQKAAD